MNKYLFTLLTLFVIAGAVAINASFAWAQNPAEDLEKLMTNPGAKKEAIQQTTDELKRIRDEALKSAKTLNEEKKTDIKDIINQVKSLPRSSSTFQDIIKKTLEQVQARRTQFQDTIQAKRTEMEAKIQTARQNLTTKLQAIKDERKKQVVERVQDQFTKILGNRLDYFTKITDKLDEILSRVKSRIEKAVAGGHDVSAAQTAVAAADKAIADARAAITALAGKTYTVSVTTEAALRTNVQATHDSLKTDLGKIRDALNAAREAIHQATRALAGIPGVDNEPVPTIPTTPSNQLLLYLIMSKIFIVLIVAVFVAGGGYLLWQQNFGNMSRPATLPSPQPVAEAPRDNGSDKVDSIEAAVNGTVIEDSDQDFMQIDGDMKSL